MIRHLGTVSLTLEPSRVRLAASLLVNTQAPKLNIPLVMFLARHLDYKDKQLPYDLIKGNGGFGQHPTVGVTN